MSAHNQNHTAVAFYACKRCWTFDLQGVLLRSYHHPSWLDRIESGICAGLLILIVDTRGSVIRVSGSLLLRYIVVAIYILSWYDLAVIYSQRQITIVEAVQAASGVGCAENRRVGIGYQLKRCIGAAARFAKTDEKRAAIERILEIEKSRRGWGGTLAVVIYQDWELIQRLAGAKRQFSTQIGLR